MMNVRNNERSSTIGAALDIIDAQLELIIDCENEYKTKQLDPTKMQVFVGCASKGLRITVFEYSLVF